MYSTDTPILPPPKSKITPGGRSTVLTEGRNTAIVWRSTVIPNKGYVYLTDRKFTTSFSVVAVQ